MNPTQPTRDLLADAPRLRVISLNLNGIRSAARKGAFEWLANQQADVVCVQELKAQAQDMEPRFISPLPLQGIFHYAEKKGYSGAGLYARLPILNPQIGFGSREFDTEGRYVRADFNTALGPIGIVSVYLPSGSSSPERQEAKFRFLKEFLPHLSSLRDESARTGREFIVCGDWNIAHQPIDLKNWRSNQKNSGFLPEERAWLSHLFEEIGFVDVFRQIDARPERYTWWSNRGQAWAKNVGWRIDYQIATPGIAARAAATDIYIEQRFSDHAPLIIDYSLG